VRDYCFIGENKMVGVGVLQLRDIVESSQNSYCDWIRLGKRFNIDETGLILLRILSQRQQDEVAKEYVNLKGNARFEVEGTLTAAISNNAVDRMSVGSNQS
jgi:protein unc-13